MNIQGTCDWYLWLRRAAATPHSKYAIEFPQNMPLPFCHGCKVLSGLSWEALLEHFVAITGI